MSARRPRVLLVAPPFAGHLNPLLGLGAGLRATGMEVTVATGAAKADAVRSVGFGVDALVADDPGVFDRISDTPGPVRSNPVRLARQLRANLALLPTVRRELDAILERDRPDVVLADMTAAVVGLVADDHDLPWVTVMPTPFVLETRTGTPAYLGGWGPARHAGHRVRDAAGRAATRAVKRGMQRALRSHFRAAGVEVYRPDGSETAYSPHAILGLGMRELELPRDWPAVFELVGPVTGTPGADVEAIELPSGPVVLVTLGTHLPWARRSLVDGARRLAAALPGTTVLVSLGDVTRPATEPVHVDGNLRIHHHVRYDDVVPRCAAVVHHGGAGITYSTIRAARPALVVPHDYDQFDFAARIVAAGVGRTVPRLDSAAAVTALRQVLDLDRGPLDRLAAAASTYDPVAATVRTVERLLRTPR